MGQIVQASELETGDLYREYRAGNRLGPGGACVRRVTGSRTVRTVETYAVLTTTDVEGRGLHGEMSLRADLSIEKLDRVDIREVVEVLKIARPGETISATYCDGGFWI